MINLRKYLAVFLVLPAGLASAYEPERASNNLAHEFAECAAYYSITSKIVSRSKPEEAKKFDKAASLATAGSNVLTSEKVTNARVEMAIKSMVRELDNDIANFSLLLNKYSDSCGAAINDPEARMNYWLKKDG